jgi:alpha-glucosidase
MSLATPPRFALATRKAGHLSLASDQGDTAHVFVLENDIVRVLVLPDGRLDQPRTFAIAPGSEDVAEDGRDRFDLGGFAQPEFVVEANTESLCIETSAIRLTVRLAGFFCSWALRLGTEWRLRREIFRAWGTRRRHEPRWSALSPNQYRCDGLQRADVRPTL